MNSGPRLITSGQDGANHLSVDVRKAEITPLESVGKLMVIHAEEVQESGVQVVHVNLVFNGIETKIVGRSVDRSG